MGREHSISIWRRGLTRLGLHRLSAVMIESSVPSRWPRTIWHAPLPFTACWDLRSFAVVMTRRLEAFGLEPAFSSCRATREAKVVLVGTRHLLPFRRRQPLCERDCGRLWTRHGTARWRMGRAVLPPDRSRWSRTELRSAIAIVSEAGKHALGPERRLAAMPQSFRSRR